MVEHFATLVAKELAAVPKGEVLTAPRIYECVLRNFNENNPLDPYTESKVRAATDIACSQHAADDLRKAAKDYLFKQWQWGTK